MVFAILNMASLEALSKSSDMALPAKKATSFTQGFVTVNKRCPLYEQPASSGPALAYLETGRRLWLTTVDSQWLVATTKVTAKEIFIPQSCIQ